MNETPQALLDKIRALLAKAESTTPGEAEALTAKASELMAKYGIDRALLAANDPTTDEIGEVELEVHAPYARDKRDLLTWIGDALGVKVIHRSRGDSKLYGVLFGWESDRERVEVLFTSLLVQAAHALAVEKVPFYDNPKAFRRTWYAGYGREINRRLKAAEARARANAAADGSQSVAGTSTELVLVGRSDKVEQAWTDRKKASKMKTAPRRKLSGYGYDAGTEAGERADLGGHKVTHARRRSLVSGS